MSYLKKILYNLPEFFLAMATGLLVFVVFGELFVRELFNVSIFGYTADLSHLLLIWISMLGAAIAVKRGSHFAFGIIAERIGIKAEPYLNIFHLVSIMGFAVVILTSGIKVLLLDINETFQALNISVMWESLAVPCSATLIIIYCINALYDQIKSMFPKS